VIEQPAPEQQPEDDTEWWIFVTAQDILNRLDQ